MPFGEGPVDELSQPPAPIRREARRSVQFNSASYGTEPAVGKVLKSISRNQVVIAPALDNLPSCINSYDSAHAACCIAPARFSSTTVAAAVFEIGTW